MPNRSFGMRVGGMTGVLLTGSSLLQREARRDFPWFEGPFQRRLCCAQTLSVIETSLIAVSLLEKHIVRRVRDKRLVADFRRRAAPFGWRQPSGSIHSLDESSLRQGITLIGAFLLTDYLKQQPGNCVGRGRTRIWHRLGLDRARVARVAPGGADHMLAENARVAVSLKRIGTKKVRRELLIALSLVLL